jgi:hypothetical protein
MIYEKKQIAISEKYLQEKIKKASNINRCSLSF